MSFSIEVTHGRGRSLVVVKATAPSAAQAVLLYQQGERMARGLPPVDHQVALDRVTEKLRGCKPGEIVYLTEAEATALYRYPEPAEPSFGMRKPGAGEAAD